MFLQQVFISLFPFYPGSNQIIPDIRNELSDEDWCPVEKDLISQISPGAQLGGNNGSDLPGIHNAYGNQQTDKKFKNIFLSCVFSFG
jgi:hypothetical protein